MPLRRRLTLAKYPGFLLVPAIELSSVLRFGGKYFVSHNPPIAAWLQNAFKEAIHAHQITGFLVQRRYARRKHNVPHASLFRRLWK